MLEAFITSKTRIKLLVKFFLNPGTKAYLRQLANEFGESTNSVRVELNRLTETGVLESSKEGNTVVYQAKISHPLFNEISSIVSKYTGIDTIVDQVVSYLGQLEKVYLIGDYAKGYDSGEIEVLLIGNIKQDYLENLVIRVEKEIHRKLKCLIFTEEESLDFLKKYHNFKLLLWHKEK